MPTERGPLTRPTPTRKIAPTATMTGQTLGHHQIGEQTGAGNLGEVYRATPSCTGTWPSRFCPDTQSVCLTEVSAAVVHELRRS